VTRGRLLVFSGLAALVIVIVVVVALPLADRKLTEYVESDAFRRELGKQTSKGLHFEGEYQAIRRTGLLTAKTEGFKGRNGVKAFKTISTGEVDAKFDPWGVFLRRWELEYIHIPSGRAEIQTYEPKPEGRPPKPWYAIFLPDRVHLNKVVCDSADVTWQLRGRKAGFFETHLLITPYGRDFEYRAEGGVMKTGMVADLVLRQLHLLITKELLTLYDLELAPGAKSSGRIRVHGWAGMKNDKSVSAEMNFSDIPVDPWIPKGWAKVIKGRASGDVAWKGADMKMESSSGWGEFRVEEGRVAGAQLLEDVASLIGKPIEQVSLSRFSLRFEWKYPRVQIKEMDIEAEGVFRLQGSATLNKNRLSGEVQLGVTPGYLEWLPKAQRIFTRQRDGYLWTTVQLGGTTDDPQEDLSPRVAQLLKKSPAAALGLFIRGIGEWFENSLAD
jgi:hypothetical protein